MFEYILYGQILHHVQPKISLSQHGFLPGRSTVTNLLVFVDRVSEVLDNGGRVDVIYTDFSKAFDTLNHDILAVRLRGFGFSSGSVAFLLSYLVQRKQYVLYNGFQSRSFCCSSGVPQGSNLGPLLFLLYVNELPDLLCNSECLMFADDAKIFKVINSIEDCAALQQDIIRLTNWCRDSGLSLNVKKCKTMMFTRQRSPIQWDYKVDGAELDHVSIFRDLGVVMDAHLSFENHIDYLISKSNQMLGFICRTCSCFRNWRSIFYLYRTLVRSVLEYAAPVWNPHHIAAITRLERIQNKFLRFTYFKRFGQFCVRDFPSTELRGIFMLPSLKSRRELLSILVWYNILHNRIRSPYLTSRVYFSIPVLMRRYHPLFFIPRSKTVNRYFSPLNRIPRLVNGLGGGIDVFADGFSTFRNKARNVIHNE